MSSLSKLLFEKASSFASIYALKIGERCITYQELNAKGLLVASALAEAGANQETVGLVGQRKVSSYLGVVGILYAGCNYTPINPKYSEARILSILKDSNIRFLVGDKQDIEMLEPILLQAGAPSIEAIILPEGKALAGKKWIDESHLGGLKPLAKPVEMGPGDLAYILFTSGSTGVPKGVQVQNSNILSFLRNMANEYKLEPGFRASQTFDFSFDPSVSDLFFTWTMGGELCVLPEEEQMLPSEYIRRERITFWNSVPTVAGFMHKMGALTPGVFPELRYSMFCGEQFPKQLADVWQEAAPNSSIENLYGPTEATIYVSRHVYTKEEKNKSFKNSIIPIGRPLKEMEFALIDETGNKVPEKEIGEIVYKGPQITKGYLNDQKKTDSVFVKFNWDKSESTWYKSGDLGFYNEDGYLECIGRRDNQIKLGGRRIEIGEIEAVFSRYPKTQGAVVVPLRDKNQIVIGCVAFTTNDITKEEEMRIRKDSLKYIERIFFPKRIITIDVFPVAPSGKTDRKALAIKAQENSG